MSEARQKLQKISTLLENLETEILECKRLLRGEKT